MTLLKCRYTFKPSIKLTMTFFSNVKEALKKILEFGCDTVIITMGEKGAVYSSKSYSDCVHVFCDKVKPKDTTVSPILTFFFSNILSV